MLPLAFSRHLLRRTYTHFSPIMESKKSLLYFTITLSLFTLSFFGLFAIRPTLITAVSLIRGVTDLRKLSKEYEEKINSLVRAQSEYEKIRDSIPSIEAALPTSASFHKLAAALEKFAEREEVNITQLQIENVPISNISTDSKLRQYNFSLVAMGNYPSLFSYLNHIINWKRIVNLSLVELNLETSTTSGILRLTLKGTTYYTQ